MFGIAITEDNGIFKLGDVSYVFGGASASGRNVDAYKLYVSLPIADSFLR